MILIIPQQWEDQEIKLFKERGYYYYALVKNHSQISYFSSLFIINNSFLWLLTSDYNMLIVGSALEIDVAC